MEEDEIVDPFYNGFYVVILQDGDSGSGHVSLDASRSGQPLDSDVLDVHTTFPEHA